MFGRDKPVSRTQITRVKDKAVDLSCVKPITIHQFRHSHASILINGGMNIVAVSRRLGHSDVEMTLKVYTHLFKNKDTEIIDFLEKSSPNLLQNLLHSSKDDWKLLKVDDLIRLNPTDNNLMRFYSNKSK